MSHSSSWRQIIELAVRNEQSFIAVVDDDESVREAVKGLIRSMGYSAEAFTCAEEFLESSHFSGTACLVADINMPGMSGLDLHSHLSRMNNSIPTVLITAYPSERLRMHALDAGVVCCLTKPFSEKDLLKCIHFALGDAADDGSVA